MTHVVRRGNLQIAVVGSGISGLVAAWVLSARHDVVLLEKEQRLGGHSNTIRVPYGESEIPVDTGFIVYNERNYPEFTGLLEHLDVATEPSCMSFAASLGNGRFEYSGASIKALIAQKRNLLNPAFAGMLLDIVRFNRMGRAFLDETPDKPISLGEFLDGGRFCSKFLDAYLLPMGAAIWSAPLESMRSFPASSFLRFFDNHGLLTVNDQPDWKTLRHRSIDYVRRIAQLLKGRVRTGFDVTGLTRGANGITLKCADGSMLEVDQVVLATHADQSMAIMSDADEEERSILSSFRFQRNSAILHSDISMMPKRRNAWASWNYISKGELNDTSAHTQAVSVTYWMNRLQLIDDRCPLFVSLNSTIEPDPKLVHKRIDYMHPLFDFGTLEAQTRIPNIQGRGGVWHAGAWLGYGFHEDGLKAGLAVAHGLGCVAPWRSSQHKESIDVETIPEQAVARLA